MINHCIICCNEIDWPFGFDDIDALKSCTQKQWEVVVYFFLQYEINSSSSFEQVI